MSTRGAIVVRQGDGFSGRYHHWDSYPDGLGKSLWELYHGFFKQDIKAMRKTLLEDHPAGWSTINEKDFSQAPGYSDSGASNPNCYCHGGRSEEASEITDQNAADCGCEYVYILNDDNLVVLSSYSGPNKMIGMFGSGDPNATWRPILEVRWDDPEPDWESVGKEEE